MTTRKKQTLVLIAALPVGAVLAGYVSNAVSRRDCERAVASWLVAQPLGGRFFYLRSAKEDPSVSEALDALGARYVVAEQRRDAWPRMRMRTRAVLPFLVAIDYEWELGPEIGAGGRRWFFCWFGHTKDLGETDHIAM
jgi:hypothetical protein